MFWPREVEVVAVVLPRLWEVAGPEPLEMVVVGVLQLLLAVQEGLFDELGYQLGNLVAIEKVELLGVEPGTHMAIVVPVGLRDGRKMAVYQVSWPWQGAI